MDNSPVTPKKNKKQPATFASVVQVRDFEFSPDDGRIAGLVIDALGIPALPVRLLGCSSVKIQLVQNITWNCITLSPGSEAYIQKLTTGLFDNAVNVLRVSQLLSHMSHFLTSHTPPHACCTPATRYSCTENCIQEQHSVSACQTWFVCASDCSRGKHTQPQSSGMLSKTSTCDGCCEMAAALQQPTQLDARSLDKFACRADVSAAVSHAISDSA